MVTEAEMYAVIHLDILLLQKFFKVLHNRLFFSSLYPCVTQKDKFCQSLEKCVNFIKIRFITNTISLSIRKTIALFHSMSLLVKDL